MKMEDQIRIEAPRDQVFAALNDPAVLKLAIPGCQELEKVSDDELEAVVQAKVGPVKAKFKGKVTLSDVNPPESYTISGEGTGGAAGFAKGGAKIMLTEDGGATVLHYAVDAEVGGKLAQIGNRLIEGTSKKLTDEFFESFSTLVGTSALADATAAAPDSPSAPDTAAPADVAAPSQAPRDAGVSPWAWAVAGAVAVLIAVWLLNG